MKLISCHIDNFGILHNFDMTFEEGLNVIMHDNGWGKSTLAAFLKAMLYGYDNKRSKDISENDRKHYQPWQGGKYGGSLTFEKGGTRYMIVRTFGATARFDTVTLRNLDTGRSMPNGENIGEWLFKLDADAFKRSAFINSNQLNSGNSGLSFHARLNAVLGEASDVGSYDSAIAQLTKRTKDYEKIGNRGHIADIQRKIDELLAQQRTAKGEIERVEALRIRILELDTRIAQTDNEISALNEIINAQDRGKKEREAAQKLYEQMQGQLSSLNKELEELLEAANGTLPTTQEINTVKQNRSEMAHITEGLAALNAQKEKELGDIQSRYDELLTRETDLSKEIEEFLAAGPVPEEGELQTIKQGRIELQRIAEALDALTAEKQGKQHEVKTKYDGLLVQQTELEQALKEIADGIGEYVPTHDEIRETKRNLSDIAESTVSAAALIQKRNQHENEICRIEKRYGGQVPPAAEITGILPLKKTLDDVRIQVLEASGNREELEQAEKEKSDIRAYFGDECPDASRLEQIRREIIEADALESSAMGLDARAEGELVTIGSKKDAIRQLAESRTLQRVSEPEPKYIAAICLFAGAAVLAALGAFITPIIFAGAALFAVLGIVFAVITSKKKKEYEKKKQAYIKERRRLSAKRSTLEEDLVRAQSSYNAKLAEAREKHGEAAALMESAVAYLKKWEDRAAAETAAQLVNDLQEKVDIYRNAERIIAAANTRLETLNNTAEELSAQLEAKVKLLPADTEAASLEERISMAEEDLDQIRQLKAELKAILGQIENHDEKIKQITDKTSAFMSMCGITMDDAEEKLAEVEQKIAEFTVAKQKLSDHQRHISDFEKTNQHILSNVETDEENSAFGRLKTQQDNLNDSIFAILGKYGVAKENEKGWIAESEQRLTIKKEFDQRQSVLAKQIAEFESVNRDALTGKVQLDSKAAMAQSNLESQMEALLSAVQEILDKYQIAEEQVDNWLAASEQNAIVQDDIRRRSAALEKQIAEFEEAHKDQLVPAEGAEAKAEESLSPNEVQLQNNVQLREALLKERTQAEDAIRHADETLKHYRAIVSRLRILADEKRNAQRSLYVLKKSIEYLKGAKDNLASRYMGQIEHNFNQYFSAWAETEDVRGVIDSNFNITMDDNGNTHDAEGYSTGYCDMIDFCMRLALIDTLYEEEKPFIIMDDPFVNLDAGRLDHAMHLLKSISADSQVIYFVCHEVRASEPTAEGLLTFGNKKLIKSAAPKKQKEKTKRSRFAIGDENVLKPVSANRKITNSIFTLEFAAAEAKEGSREYEIFFVDENEKVLCDRQQISLAGKEIIPEKVRFCLNTGNAAGKVYNLFIRNVSAAENEIAQKIPYESAIAFTADFDF